MKLIARIKEDSILERVMKKGKVTKLSLYGNSFKLVKGIYICKTIIDIEQLQKNDNIIIEMFSNIDFNQLLQQVF